MINVVTCAMIVNSKNVSNKVKQRRINKDVKQKLAIFFYH